MIPVGEGAPVLEALRGDCHVHTTWSDGGAPLEAMATTAIALGHEWMVITDHSARLTIAHGLDEQRLAHQLDAIAELNEQVAPFRLLTGMEVDIFEDGSLDLADEMLARARRRGRGQRALQDEAPPRRDDPPHGHRRSPVPTSTCSAISPTASSTDGAARRATSIAEIVFAACARFDTAVEINCRPERQDPPEELLELALEWECKIAINTDAHATGQLEWLPYGADKAVRCGVPVDDIVNTWSADDLLAWTASHAPH